VANIQFGIVEADNNSKELVKFGGVSAVSPDGRFVVYVKSDSKGDRGLWRMNLSDGSEKQLTIGVEVHPTFSPDGKWILYTRFGEQIALWKVSIDGGEAEMILHEDALCPAVSPDGKTVAFVLRRAGQPNRIALMPFDGGKIIKTFDAKLETNPVSNKQKLQWTPDGRAMNFILLNDGVSNIWRQPIDGSAPVQVTNFKEDRIFNFAFSADSLQLALSRGTFNSDVVLIENAR
jgi:Tol biopolymer transport system component